MAAASLDNFENYLHVFPVFDVPHMVELLVLTLKVNMVIVYNGT